MAKHKSPAAAVALGAANAVSRDAIKEQRATELEHLEAGRRPFTVIAGSHYERANNPDTGLAELAGPFKAGDVVYTTRDLAVLYPEKFVAGRTMPDNTGRQVSTPGLGQNVTESLNAGGYLVYAKDGLVHAYKPGEFGVPASPQLIDLAAAEEWIENNPL